MTQTQFLSVVGPLQPRMYRLAFSFFKNEEESGDVVQDILVKIWEKKELLAGVENTEAWCIRIAKNMILDRLKYNSYRKMSTTERQTENSADINLQEQAETKDMVNWLNMIISQLPEKYRFFIHLRDIEGLTYNEIAEIMEVKLDAVKSGISRARKMIREKLENLNSYGTR